MAFERMANRYSTQKDLVDRLHGTICRYNDVPVNVTFITTNCLALSDIVTGETIARVAPNDPYFDISSPELGYFNFLFKENPNEVIYVTRLPLRRYRQGLYQQTCEFEQIDGSSIRSMYGRNFFASAGFKDSLMKVFPNLTEAVAMLDEKLTEVAISQEVALKKTESGMVLVYFRTKNVGWIKPGDTAIEMTTSEFDWVVTRYFTRLGLSFMEKNVG